MSDRPQRTDQINALRNDQGDRRDAASLYAPLSPMIKEIRLMIKTRESRELTAPLTLPEEYEPDEHDLDQLNLFITEFKHARKAPDSPTIEHIMAEFYDEIGSGRL